MGLPPVSGVTKEGISLIMNDLAADATPPDECCAVHNRHSGAFTRAPTMGISSRLARTAQVRDAGTQWGHSPLR
jgi:hypothetical protein